MGLLGLYNRFTTNLLGKDRKRDSDPGIAASDDAHLVHTLVTISQLGVRNSSPSLEFGSYKASLSTTMLEGHGAYSDPHASIGHLPTDLVVSTEVDDILYERLREYRQSSPNEGCVLLVTEALPSSTQTAAEDRYVSLNGAVAAMNFARAVAATHGITTLLIDLGSKAWSAQRSSQNPSDILSLPNMPGVYDVIQGNGSLEDWMLEEEGTPNLIAIGAGTIPPNWLEIINSWEMAQLIQSARSLAELVVIYGPRCLERPETVRGLATSSNGIMIVSGIDSLAEQAEYEALAMLQGAGTAVFGRIALNTTISEFKLASSDSQSTNVQNRSLSNIEAV